MYVPPGFGVVFPYLVVHDAAAHVAFLGEAFGATEVGRTVIDGRIANVELDFSGTHIFLSEARDEADISRISLYLYVADADAAMARALAAGATEVMKVADQPYGDRQGGVRDPAGIVWWISQRTEHGPYTH